MNINPINQISTNYLNFKNNKSNAVNKTDGCPDGEKLVKELDKMSMMNNVNIGKRITN